MIRSCRYLPFSSVSFLERPFDAGCGKERQYRSRRETSCHCHSLPIRSHSATKFSVLALCSNISPSNRSWISMRIWRPIYDNWNLVTSKDTSFFFFSNLLFITSDGIYRHLSTSIDCFLLSCSFPGSILGPQHGSLEMNLMSTNCEPFVTAF